MRTCSGQHFCSKFSSPFCHIRSPERAAHAAPALLLLFFLLCSPAPPFPSLLASILFSFACLSVKVLPYWRLGYPPPGPRTRASHRRTPGLGLSTHGSDHGNHRNLDQVYRRVSAVRGAREVSSRPVHRVCLIVSSPTPATSPHTIRR